VTAAPLGCAEYQAWGGLETEEVSDMGSYENRLRLSDQAGNMRKI